EPPEPAPATGRSGGAARPAGRPRFCLPSSPREGPMRGRRRPSAAPATSQAPLPGVGVAAHPTLRGDPDHARPGAADGVQPPPTRQRVPAIGPAGMPPAGTLARGRGRLIAAEGDGPFIFEFGELRYRICLGPREAPSPLLRIDIAADHGDWHPVCAAAGM